uniref:Replication factor C subunit 1 n=1 Tax=Glossina brevipalpis TaxID=37001 RepID=A0A1A9WWE9_9MUSC
MQPTIASFFKKDSTKKINKTQSTVNNDERKDENKPKKRKALLVVSSDEEKDEIKPQNSKKSRTEVKEKTNNDLNNKSPNAGTKKPNLSKLSQAKSAKLSPKKEKLSIVDPMILFGAEAKRINVKKSLKPKVDALFELENDQIDQSLMEINLDIDQNNLITQNHDGSEQQKEISSKKISPRSEEKKEKFSKIRNGKPTMDTEINMLTDEERYERKRASAVLYQKYKNRSSVLNHGCKEIPEGKPDCLAGLTFLVTGVLESLERSEAEDLIKQYGGKVMTTVGKRLKYLIVGEDAGPKKLAVAEENSIQIISEDQFLDLIREKSNSKEKIKAEKNNLAEDTKKKETNQNPKNINETKSPIKKKMKLTPENNIKSERLDSQIVKENKKQKAFKFDERQSNMLKANKSPENAKKELEFVSKESTTKIQIKLESENTIQSAKIVSSPLKVKNNQKEANFIRKHNEINENNLTWVDKYKPSSIKDIVGQQGPSSNVNKLLNWLRKWFENRNGKKTLQKPNPWAKNDDGSYYKAALLSGPPGIGKTTTANLVCKELDFDIVEFNASDTRSKRLLKEEISELLSNKSLYGYFHGGSQAMTKKHVLIMDEVDGMAGNEDRGGMQELIALIKNSSIPIICMCNDRNHPKIRSLINYCYDLRFNRPQLRQIKGCILSICAKEHFKLDPIKIEELILATNNDIRQSINHIALLSAGKELQLSLISDKKEINEKVAQKDLKMGPWDVIRKVFSAEEHKNMNFNDKSDLFFHDYSLAPLFVQQNYLIVNPIGSRNEVLKKVALTADALSLSDLVDRRIRSQSAWALLPTQAVFSSVMPGEYMKGSFMGQINFPAWLGKNSKTTKRNRLAQELHDHTRIRTSGSRLSIRLDYAAFLLHKIVNPLKQNGLEGVNESLNTIKEYHLLREDLESLIELTTWPGKKNPMDSVDSKVKAALTRAYNKEVLAYSYSAAAGIKKKRREASEDLNFMDIDNNGENEENSLTAHQDEDELENVDDDDDNLENDGLIKVKKRSNTANHSNSTKTSNSKKSASSKTKIANKSKK